MVYHMSIAAEKPEHKAAIASLSQTARSQLLRKSNAAGAMQLSIHILALAVAAAGMQLGGWLWLPGVLVYAVLLVFLFAAQHECVHSTAFASRRANQWLAAVIGTLLFNPARWFRYFHLAHHRYTQDPERDPELQSPRPEGLPTYIWHVLGWSTIASSFKTVLRNALQPLEEPWVPANQRAGVKRESRVMLALYALAFALSVATSSSVLIEFWLLPLVLGQPFLRLYLMAEHGRCAFVANMFENTRTTFTNALVRRIAWNMPYHAEHHAFPSVPFHKLPQWHARVRDDLRCTSAGYLRFHRDYIEDLE